MKTLLRKTNEKGYALLLVLFLIVFIMIVSTVVIRGSLSHANQEKVVDTNHLTVVTAEAGIELVKSALNNEFYSHEKELDDFAKNKIKNTTKRTDAFFQDLQKEMANKLKIYLENRVKNDHFKVQENLGNKFKFQLVSYQGSTTSISGQVTIIGTIKSENLVNRKTQLLDFEHVFQVPSYNPTSQSTGGSQQTGVNMHKLYPGTPALPSCQKNSDIDNKKCIADRDGNYKEIEDSKVYFPNGFIKKKGELEIDESIIYVNGTFDVNEIDDMEDSEFYIDGNLLVNKIESVEESKLFINGAATFRSSVELEESSLTVRGALQVTGNLELEDNSLVCVAGSMTITDKLNIESGSAVYVWGTVTYKSIKGKITYVNSEQELWTKCKVGSGGEAGEVIWVKPKITSVEYVK